MHIPLEQIVRMVISEAYKHRTLIVFAFVFISVSVLGVGLVWPKKYTSSTTILVDNRSVIAPILGGAAEPTDVSGFASIAEEIIHGRRLLHKIAEIGGWLPDKNITPVQLEELIESIKQRTVVESLGKELIKIEYRDSDPQRAFLVTKNLADLFMEESVQAKNEESRNAFEFIDKQVKKYHTKLLETEEKLNEFRTKYADAGPGAEGEVSTRISQLTDRIETTTLELKEAQIRKTSLEKQLSGEAAITESISREGNFATRIRELQTQLDTLLLTYKDTYPDVVRIRHQIQELKESVKAEKIRRERDKADAKAHGQTYVDQGVALSPLYQTLRGELSQTKTTLETLKTRLVEIRRLLEREMDRAKRISDGEAALAELTRDYQVNQNLYQDLLRRRENARVTMNLDQERQGLNFKIKEPAALSLKPTGLRFLHFAIGSPVLGIGVPLGLLYLLLQIDPRVRNPAIISEKLKVPVIATIPHFPTPGEMRRSTWNSVALFIIVFGIFGLIGYVSWLKWTGALVGVTFK